MRDVLNESVGHYYSRYCDGQLISICACSTIFVKVYSYVYVTTFFSKHIIGISVYLHIAHRTLEATGHCAIQDPSPCRYVGHRRRRPELHVLTGRYYPVRDHQPKVWPGLLGRLHCGGHAEMRLERDRSYVALQ